MEHSLNIRVKLHMGNVQLNQVDFNLGAGGASMIPSGTQYYTTGTTIVVRAVASLGNQFLSWTSTGSITFDSTSSAITNAHIDGAGEITANFITVQPTQNYQVSWILGSRRIFNESIRHSNIRGWFRRTN